MISKQWQRRQMKKLGHQLPRNWTPPPKNAALKSIVTASKPHETQAEMIDRKLRARGFDLRDENGNPGSLSNLPNDYLIMFWSYCPSCKRRHERELTAGELKEIVLTDADPWEHGGHKQSEFRIRKSKTNKEQAHATVQ